jgi:nicotinate dehydrogenase subunit A
VAHRAPPPPDLRPAPLAFELDGGRFEASVPPAATLLQVLRNDAERHGPKYGCGLGGCGACTVLVDDRVARACVIPAHGVAGRRVTTLDGLGTRDAPHPVQQAFIDAQAAQCGYCTNGMVMATVALLRRNPQPTDQEAREALSHNLCRCGTHVEILQAVQLAANRMAPHRDAGMAPSPTPVGEGWGEGRTL